MKQTITLHIYQQDHLEGDQLLGQFDYYAYGYEPEEDSGRKRLKIGEIKVDVDSVSKQTLNAARLDTLRAKLGEKAAECTEIERQIQNLLAIEA